MGGVLKDAFWRDRERRASLEDDAQRYSTELKAANDRVYDLQGEIERLRAELAGFRAAGPPATAADREALGRVVYEGLVATDIYPGWGSWPAWEDRTDHERYCGIADAVAAAIAAPSPTAVVEVYFDDRKQETHGFEDADEAIRFTRTQSIAVMSRVTGWIWHPAVEPGP